MLPNASISAIERATKTKADGTPYLEAITLIGDIPCRIVDPHQGHELRAQSRGVTVSRVMKVRAGAFRPIDYTPDAGDRITFTRSAPGEAFAAETLAVRDVSRTQPGPVGLIDEYTLMLDTVEDGAS
tara:strand:- start:4019 stop:4399 length:381 start_codon:yes stop_codon:yes gene_type:complete